MTTREFIHFTGRRKWIILLTMLLTVAAVGALLALQPETVPAYGASAILRLSSASKTVNFDRAQLTYAELARSKVVLVEVIRRLNLATSPTELAEKITVEAIPNTELIRIAAHSTDPEEAVSLANTVSQILVEKDQANRPPTSQTSLLGSELTVAQEQLIQDKAQLQLLLLNYRVIQPGEQEALQAKIAIEEKAFSDLLDRLIESRVADALNAQSLSIYESALSVDLVAGNSQEALFLALAALTGLLGGFGLAFLQESLDNRLRSPQQIEQRTGLPVLTQVPTLPKGSQGKPDEMAVTEAFRALQAHLWSPTDGGKGRPGSSTVMVASPGPLEGKSFVAARLATALASAGRSVILADLDLRRPTVHAQFGLSNDVGVSDLLNGIPAAPPALDIQAPTVGGRGPSHVSDWASAETTWSPVKFLRPTRFPGLRVLTSGPVPANPVRLLSVDRVRQLLDRLAMQADIVVIDSPAMLGLADSLILAPLTDGVILVVSAERSTEEGLENAATQLKRVNANVLGVVLNRARVEVHPVYDYYRRNVYVSGRHAPTAPSSASNASSADRAPAATASQRTVQ